jgi:hypothetical protein
MLAAGSAMGDGSQVAARSWWSCLDTILYVAALEQAHLSGFDVDCFICCCPGVEVMLCTSLEKGEETCDVALHLRHLVKGHSTISG